MPSSKPAARALGGLGFSFGSGLLNISLTALVTLSGKTSFKTLNSSAKLVVGPLSVELLVLIEVRGGTGGLTVFGTDRGGVVSMDALACPLCGM